MIICSSSEYPCITWTTLSFFRLRSDHTMLIEFFVKNIYIYIHICIDINIEVFVGPCINDLWSSLQTVRCNELFVYLLLYNVRPFLAIVYVDTTISSYSWPGKLYILLAHRVLRTSIKAIDQWLHLKFTQCSQIGPFVIRLFSVNLTYVGS